MQSADNDHERSKWVRELRRHYEGTFVAGDRAQPIRFVVNGATGRLIIPVEQWMLDGVDGVVFMPEERRDALQVLVELEEAACGASEDRWTAYHGESRARCWASARIMGVRRDDEVSDHDGLCVENPLRSAESQLLRMINAHRGVLGATCERLSGVHVTDACVVGIDPLGMDVRARFGIIRAEFPAESCGPRGVESAERAATILRMLIGDAGGAID